MQPNNSTNDINIYIYYFRVLVNTLKVLLWMLMLIYNNYYEFEKNILSVSIVFIKQKFT